MNYKIRPVVLDEDYGQLMRLWEKSKMGVAPPMWMLPETGFVAVDENKYVIGGLFNFIIQKSKLALIGYPVLAHFIDDKVLRSDILDDLYLHCERQAKKEGCYLAQTFTNLDTIKIKLEYNGWVIGDKSMDNYIKLIN